MLNKFKLISLTFLISATLSAQRTPYEKGTMLIHAGLGFYSTVYTSEHSPSYNIGIERGVASAGPGIIGVGLVGNFQTSSFNSYETGSTANYYIFDMKSYTFDIRGTYHPAFFPSKIIDVYGGFSIGANFINKNVTPSGSPFTSPNLDLGPKSDLHIGLLAGFRAYLFPKIGIFGEAGYDVSPLKLGLVAKF